MSVSLIYRGLVWYEIIYDTYWWIERSADARMDLEWRGSTAMIETVLSIEYKPQNHQ